MSDFELKLVLGRGAFGKVYLAELKEEKLSVFDEPFYAIKSIRKDILLEENKVENTVIEMSILLESEHPFLASMSYLF